MEADLDGEGLRRVEGRETIIRIYSIKRKIPLFSNKKKMCYHMSAVMETNVLRHGASKAGSQNETFYLYKFVILGVCHSDRKLP